MTQPDPTSTEESPASVEGAVQLEALDIRGRTWFSADSLADLFEQMRSDAADGPVKTTMATLTELFRGASSYAEMEAAASSDDSTIAARLCGCGTAVIDGRNIGGDTIVINAEPDPAGELFPIKIRDGVPTLAPWRAGLDGIEAATIRLSRHHCPAGAGAARLCPEHGIPDCSPLLNGCSRLTDPPAEPPAGTTPWQPEWLWLSFADPKLPEGEQFLGWAMVRGSDVVEAARRAHQLGINPGGEVAAMPLPPGYEPADGYAERLFAGEEGKRLAEADSPVYLRQISEEPQVELADRFPQRVDTPCNAGLASSPDDEVPDDRVLEGGPEDWAAAEDGSGADDQPTE